MAVAMMRSPNTSPQGTEALAAGREQVK